jgi:hypothetical protein
MTLRGVRFAVFFAGIMGAHFNIAGAGNIVPGTTDPADKIDAGSFAAGTVITLGASGTVDLGADSYNVFVTNQDGSLVHNNTTDPTYRYINPGATNYPTAFGGDGINHYTGGGANFDVVANVFGPAGDMSTDTTDPKTIRLGALIATFSSSPSRSDWFEVGFGTTVVSPSSSDHLYFAVNDTFYPNNLGAYNVIISTSSVPEPSTLMLISIGSIVVGCSLLCKRTVP